MIPQSIAKYFWDIKPDTLDMNKHERTIVSRVLNYGTLSDWRWLADKYGKTHVAGIANTEGRTSVKEPTRRLASILFS